MTETDAQRAGLPPSHRMIAFRIIQLHFLIRSAAAPLYRRELGLTAGEVGVMLSLGYWHRLTASQLRHMLGQSKSQISRLLAPMLAQGYITRAALRAPLVLTAEGTALLARIRVLARDNTARLFDDVGADQLASLDRALGPLRAAAELLLENAQTKADATDRLPAFPQPSPDEDEHEEGGDADAAATAPSQVLRRLTALSSVLRRSAALAFLEIVSLSGFKWVALLRIAEFEPLRLAELIAMTGRDKGQIGRVVDELEANGLIRRHAGHGRGRLTLRLTAQGREVFALVTAEMQRREALLIAGLTDAECRSVIETIDTIADNARRWIAENRG
ncbi:MAG TPA: MarR family transcriptional regulator, partial [Sphingomonadaceae bacterium]|nr:MarR family transcriptional regulator [Sphingomonadaceae bacterium]